jgi:hypothetical protein
LAGVLEGGKAVLVRQKLNQEKTADFRGAKEHGEAGDCNASVHALHKIHSAAYVGHPLPSCTSANSRAHISLCLQLLGTRGEGLRQPHTHDQLTTTIAIYIVLSMINYMPDVRHAARYFSQSLARNKQGTDVLDNDELEAKLAADLPLTISAYVVSPGGHRIPQAAVGGNAQPVATVMSNDRLKRIAEGTRYMDKGGAPAEVMDGGGRCTAISVSSRVFVRCYEESTKQHRIWIGRVQKMGRKLEKKTYEYQDPVHINRISGGCYTYCHWYMERYQSDQPTNGCTTV